MSRLPEPLRSLVESGDAARLRRDAGIRQVTLAAALGCSRTQVSVYERGLRSPGPSRAVSWLRILNGLAWHLAIPEESGNRVTACNVTNPERQDRTIDHRGSTRLPGQRKEHNRMPGTPVTEQEIIEAPVTGMAGRTPREAIEKPMTERDLEVILVGDVSGSNAEQAAPDSPVTKQELITGALPHLVAALEGDDSQAAREQAGGSSARGGVRTFWANEPQPIEFEPGEDESDDPRDARDLNTANIPEKLAEIPWGGRIYLMPAIKAAEHAYQAEFGDIPLRKRPAMEVLIITDGKLNDPEEFERWLAQADETCVVCVAVVGYGKGHDAAVAHYQALAEKNKFLTYVALTGVSDPAEVALDLRLLSGTAPVS